MSDHLRRIANKIFEEDRLTFAVEEVFWDLGEHIDMSEEATFKNGFRDILEDLKLMDGNDFEDAVAEAQSAEEVYNLLEKLVSERKEALADDGDKKGCFTMDCC